MRRQPSNQIKPSGLAGTPAPDFDAAFRKFNSNFLSAISRWRSATILGNPRDRDSNFQRFTAELAVFDALFKQYGPICRQQSSEIASTLARKKDVAGLTLLAIYADSVLGDSALAELRKLKFSRNAELSEGACEGLEKVAIASSQNRAKSAIKALLNDYDAQSLYETALMLDPSEDKNELFVSIIDHISALDKYERDGVRIDSKELLTTLELSQVLSADRRGIVAETLAEMAGQASDLNALPEDYNDDADGSGNQPL